MHTHIFRVKTQVQNQKGYLIDKARSEEICAHFRWPSLKRSFLNSSQLLYSVYTLWDGAIVAISIQYLA